jgi:hypothetical protein
MTEFVCSQGSAPLEDKDHVLFREFDAAVSNTALMDIASITPLLRAVRRSLKAGSRLVFSFPRPGFNTNGTTAGGGTITRTTGV